VRARALWADKLTASSVKMLLERAEKLGLLD
jgi:hypothetical protein